MSAGQPYLFSGEDGADLDPWAASASSHCRQLQSTQRLAPGHTEPSGLCAIAILNRLVPRSEAHGLVTEAIKELAYAFEEATLGYFPRELPPAVRDQVKGRLPTTADRDRHIDAVWDERIGPIVRAASQAGRLGSPAGSSDRKDTLWSATGRQPNTPLMQTKTAAGAVVFDNSRLAHTPLQVGIEEISPAAAMGQVLIALLYMVHKAATPQQLAGWRDMARAGSQGERSAPAWAGQVRRVYELVKSSSEVTAGQDLRTFLSGLNDSDERGVPLRKQMLAWHAANTSANLQQALAQLAELQQQQHQYGEEQLRLNLHGSVSGSHMVSSTRHSSSKEVQLPHGHTWCLEYSDRQVAEKLDSLEAQGKLRCAREYVHGLLISATKFGEGAGAAICCKHPLGSGQPHSNRECMVQQRAKEQQPPRPRRSQQQPAPAHSSAAAQQAEVRSSSDAAALLSLQQQVAQLQLQLISQAHSSGSGHHAAAGQGMPKQVPRATEPIRARQQQRQFGGQPPGSGCALCGFDGGHSPENCYVQNPALAQRQNAAWGPPATVPVEGIECYVRRCHEQGVPLQLNRARVATQQLLQSNRLPPELQLKVQASLAPAQHAAAGQFMQQPLAPPALQQQQGWQQPLALSAPQQQQGWQQPSFMAAQQQGLPYAVQTPGSSSGGAVFLHAGDDYLGSAGGYAGFYQGAAAQFYQDCMPAEAAAAARRGSKRLYPPNQLVGFTPMVDLPAADPNTAAGGRAQPPPPPPSVAPASRAAEAAAAEQESHSLLLRLARYMAKLQQAPSAEAAGTEQEGHSLMRQLAEHMAKLQQGTACVAAAAASSRQPAVVARAAGEQSPVLVDAGSAACPRLLFKPPPLDLTSGSGSMRCMHKLVQSADEAAGLRILTGDMRGLSNSSLAAVQPATGGRSITPANVAEDNGTNLLFFTEQFCQQQGIGFNRSKGPDVALFGGKVSSLSVGRTEPVTLLLGEGTEAPLTVHVQEGAHVMAGDAGGMFEVCLDTNTLSPWHAHVNPALGHLCWYPGATRGDLSTLNGVPVVISRPVGGRFPAAAAQAGAFVAAAGQQLADEAACSLCSSGSSPAAATQARGYVTAAGQQLPNNATRSLCSSSCSSSSCSSSSSSSKSIRRGKGAGNRDFRCCCWEQHGEAALQQQ